ncbi:MAG: 3-deoxy-D-manno-octulosonic acid transferase, partial [Verrucomicrobiales bacterium]|nr:3-deoxy-D-manno-octulosonic acid transferase [Verrucomicrobiales bacterium]
MRTIYNVIFNVGFLLGAPYYFFRLWRRGHWREGFGQRFGNYSAKIKQAITNRRVIWVHGVSVGEVNLANLLVQALEDRLPAFKFVISTTTTTGMGELRRKAPMSVEKVYYPIDRRPWVRRACNTLHPRAVVLVEAELWPNFLWHIKRRGVPVMLVNARISDRSFRRYRRFGFLFRNFFRQFAAVTTQSERDAQRLRELGCAPRAVHAVGSLKFEPPAVANDLVLDVAKLLRHAGMRDGARVLLAASTHEGEEALIAEIFSRLRTRHPDLFLVLVPRHFERSKSVGSQLNRQRLRYEYRSEIRYSSEPAPGSNDCLLVNSTGELRQFFPHATVVFIGKSLVGRGGQNPIEPAAAGKPIVFGPHMQNFPDIVPRFLEADAAVQVGDAAELERALNDLLSDPTRCATLGANARRVVEANRGALERTVSTIVATLEAEGV